MPMKCDLCDKPAVVHEVTIKDGVKNEVHLCEEHAQAAGIAPPGHQPINKLLTQYVFASKAAKQSRQRPQKTCPNCGMSLADFRQSGVVGCPECYGAFDEQLAPLIERAQNGGTSHTGKSPKRGGASIDRQLLIQRLVRELEDAVGAEQYERAAELRDKLQVMQSEVTAAGPQGDGGEEG